MKQLYFALFFFMFFISRTSAQEKSCEVMLDALKGTYTGPCINGKAHGNGKSVGVDVFEGEFKNGYPDGFGKYTWENKTYYEGNWKKGRMEGTGEMHMKTPMGLDTLIKGFWKKNKYIGPFEKQYIVIASTTRVAKVNCSLTNKGGNDIFITVHQLLNSTDIRSGAIIPFINNISTITGTFYTNNNQVMSNNSMMKIQGVIFPFRAIFYLNNGESTEIQFNEKGNYDVYIDIQ